MPTHIIEGEFSVFTVGPLWQKLKPQLHDTDALVIDLQQVSHCDSAGAQLLLELFQTRKNRELPLQLFRPSSPVIDTLQTSGLSWLITENGQGEEINGP